MKKISAIAFLLALIIGVSILAACGSTAPNASSTETSLIESSASAETSLHSTETPIPSVETPTLSSETPTETQAVPDFDAMRRLVYSEYPAVSNFEWTYDLYHEKTLLQYNNSIEYWEEVGFDYPTYDDWISPFVDYVMVTLIDPLSDSTVTMQQYEQLYEGLNAREYEEILGGYPNYRYGLVDDYFGKGETYYYCLDDGRIIKLISTVSVTGTFPVDALQEYEWLIDGKYWARKLISFEIISFDDFLIEAARAMEEYPEHAEQYDPRESQDSYYLDLFKDVWPEVFVTKYGME